MDDKMKMNAARILVSMKAPYFTHGLVSLVFHRVPDLSVKTIGVTKDGIVLWHPEFVDEISVEELAGVLIHELQHVLRRHAKRREAAGTEPNLWNIAADCEINDDVRQIQGVSLPSSSHQGFYPETFGMKPGGLAEEYYWKLREQQTQGGGPDPEQQPYCGSGAGNPLPGEEEAKGATAGQGVGEEGKGDSTKSGPAPVGRSEQDLESIRQQVARAIQAEQEKGRGTVPNGLGRWANDQLAPPKIDWRRKLAQKVRHCMAWRPGAVDFLYDRPSRRQSAYFGMAQAPILPSLHQPTPRVAVAVDTSGSMSEHELTLALQETAGVLEAVGAKVDFLACDARVNELQRISNVQEARGLLTGGGGTDFIPVFDAVQNMRPKPEVLIFVTDGCGRAPKVCPAGLRVVWVLVGGYRETPYFKGEPFGEIVEVDDAA